MRSGELVDREDAKSVIILCVVKCIALVNCRQRLAFCEPLYDGGAFCLFLKLGLTDSASVSTHPLTATPARD